ncbi:hypothetical protein [Sphingomonas faeni]|uniref:hypothetical protein n=1 Tax=Sphingomonas faeni TaxID=185950 RepID=UPI00335581E4
MIPLLKPANALPDALQYYVAAELLDDPFAITLSPGGGMPADTVHLPAASVILSVTCVTQPMFRNKVHDLARDSSIDVILLRCCLTPGDILPITADVTLAGGGLAPFDMHDLSLYRHRDRKLWLVPESFGGAIRLGHGGAELCLVPPYETRVERADGIYRSASELAALLYPSKTN